MNVFETYFKEDNFKNSIIKRQLIVNNFCDENGNLSPRVPEEIFINFLNGKPLEDFRAGTYYKYTYSNHNIEVETSNYSFSNRLVKKKRERNENTQKKDNNILVRVNDKEKEKIKKNSEKYGLKVSQYSREMLLNGKVIVLSDKEKINITRIGINFNQFVKLWTSTGQKPLEIENEFRELLETLKNCYNK